MAKSRARLVAARSDGLQVTRVGLWFLVLLVLVIVAATNTGNNGLFLAMAVMGSAVLVSQVLGRWNVRGLEVRLRPPPEIFANTPVRLEVEVRNTSRWLPRCLLIVAVDPRDVEPLFRRAHDVVEVRSAPALLPHLERRQETLAHLELAMRRRGRHLVPRVHVSSLFPVGFFRKGMRYPAATELLVYPETFSPSVVRPARSGRAGEEASHRAGGGHDLYGLRSFRHGDDPRGIHWKQSARTGGLIFNERETEESRRLLIALDNAVGKLSDPAADKRFERLVSEAATAALDYLANGWEVALVTRDVSLPFAAGHRQRRRILKALALVESRPEAERPLHVPQPEIPYLSLAMPEEDVA